MHEIHEKGLEGFSDTSHMSYHLTNRRKFIRNALLASAAAVATPRLSWLARASQEPLRPLAPVKVARNRIIRTVVGLRPFRPEGFVVREERVGNKLLIHNYGHGGSGVTLSWGTSSLAVDLAREAASSQVRRRSRTRPKRFAVLGCGVVGLSTARLLQQRFQDGPGTVTIYARDLPPDTTSNVAGALWHASAPFDQGRVTEAFNQQFEQACRISHRTFQGYVEPDYGVRWLDAYEFLSNERSLQRELTCASMPYSAIQYHRDPQRYFGFQYTRQFSTLMIEPFKYLRSLMRDFYQAGGKVVVRDFRSREEVARLPEPIIFNCTGLGARELFGDQNLVPVRGQLEILVPQPEVNYCYLSGAGYMFPRSDGIVLGGTWDRDDWSLAANPEHTTSILEGALSIMNRAQR